MMTSFRNMASSGKVAFAVAFAAKLFVDVLPDALVESVFTRPASRVAAFYLGAAFDPSAMRLSARGVTLEVVRACSATDFFSILLALLAFAIPVRSLPLRIPAAVLSAWLVAVLANAVRLVLLVYADGFFPTSQIPAVHMALGIAVFLPVFALLWHLLATRKDVSNGNADKQR